MRSEKHWRDRRGGIALTVGLLMLAGMLGGCGASGREPGPQPSPASAAADPRAREIEAGESTAAPETDSRGEENMDKSLTLFIDGEELPVTWEENDAVKALKELTASEALTVQMAGYGGFEQVGPLGTSLPRDDVQTTTGPGDIVLYAGDQIVIFYGSNSWAYTRLGHVELPQRELRERLGSGDVTVTLE